MYFLRYGPKAVVGVLEPAEHDGFLDEELSPIIRINQRGGPSWVIEIVEISEGDHTGVIQYDPSIDCVTVSARLNAQQLVSSKQPTCIEISGGCPNLGYPWLVLAFNLNPCDVIPQFGEPEKIVKQEWMAV